jgi:3-methyladenine DNA glycosylase Tag
MCSHKAPWQCTFAKEEKSKCEPGLPPKSDQEYFEALSLCILQAGLNWAMVRKIWPKLKQGFCEFEIDALSKSGVATIWQNPNVIKNKKKIEALINNAKEFKKIQSEYGSFESYLGNIPEGKAIQSLTQRFDHLGKYSAEYFLHGTGYWPRIGTNK